MVQTDYIETSGLTYSGTAANDIFAKDVYSLDMRGYGITFIDGVKSRRKIYLGKLDEMFQAYTCPFTPDGQVEISEAYIDPVAIKVNKEFCRNEFWDSFLVEQTSITLNGGIPQTFYDWYFGKMREELQKEYEEIFWKGDTAYSGSTKRYIKVTNGIEKILETASGVSKISGAAFTVDNIIAQVESNVSSGMAKAASEDLDPSKWKIFMNYADVQLLRVALGKVCCPNSTNQVFANYADNNGTIMIFGFPVQATMQSRNTIIFGDPRNLVLGFDTFDSHIQYKIVNMLDTTLDDAYRVAVVSNIAVGVVWPELFTYTRIPA